MGKIPDFDTFDKLSGQSFKATLNDKDFELICCRVKSARAPKGYSCFALHFRGAKEFAFEQQTISLEHADTGPMDLFLVPFALDEDGYRYEAIINQKID